MLDAREERNGTDHVLKIVADTIKILVATDSHVGYNERDAIRGDDSWKSFHEAMCLAKDQDVSIAFDVARFSLCAKKELRWI